MVQPTLHQYFPSPRPRNAPPSKTFLQLPFTLRREIYLLAGLLTDSTVYLNYIPSSNDHCAQDYNPLFPDQWPVEPFITPRSHSLTHFLDGYLPQSQIYLNRHCGCQDRNSNASYNPNAIWSYTACNCAPLPWQLLYVSKAITHEVTSIFYSENHFSVFRKSLGGLSVLSSLPKYALAEIRSLSICLNYFERDENQRSKAASFGPGMENWDIDCHALCNKSRSQRLFAKAKRHHEEASIDELQQLCQLLSTHIPPHQLKLSFICDVADTSIAEEVLCPLSQLPRLRQCSIRLGFLFLPNDKTDYTPLQHLAEQVVMHLTSPPINKPFNFPALPPEIQLQILSHTSLATPYDLIWATNTLISKTTKAPFYEPRTYPWRAYASYAECCTKCSPSQTPSSSSSSSSNPQSCFCYTTHAAFSSTCTCFRFPLALFLLSKSFKKIAEEVFYGRNHFYILPRGYSWSRKLEIYDFLTWVPESARRYLKFLTWEMSWGVSGEWGGYLQPVDETYTQWLATLSLLKAIPAGQVTLGIETSFSRSAIYIHHGGWEYGDTGVVVPDSVYRAEADFTFDIQARLARDLVHHGIVLRDLFWWLEGLKFKPDGEGGWGEVEEDRGRKLEKLVMGEAYEGVQRGKGERRQEWNGWRRDQPPW